MNVLIVVRNQEAVRNIERSMPRNVKAVSPGAATYGHRFYLILVTEPMGSMAEVEWMNDVLPTRLSLDGRIVRLWEKGL